MSSAGTAAASAPAAGDDDATADTCGAEGDVIKDLVLSVIRHAQNCPNNYTHKVMEEMKELHPDLYLTKEKVSR